MLNVTKVFENIQVQQKIEIPAQCKEVQYTQNELQNLSIVVEYVRMVCSHDAKDPELIKKFVAPNNQFCSGAWPEIHTIDEAINNVKCFTVASSDHRVIAYDMIFCKENNVAVRMRHELTHDLKPIGNIQPSGKKARWSELVLFTLENGKIKTIFQEMDRTAAFRDLGIPQEEYVKFIC